MRKSRRVRSGFRRGNSDWTRRRHKEGDTVLCANWGPWLRLFYRKSRDGWTESSPQWRCSVSQLWPLTPDQPRPQRRGCREKWMIFSFFCIPLDRDATTRSSLHLRLTVLWWLNTRVRALPLVPLWLANTAWLGWNNSASCVGPLPGGRHC